MLPKPSQYIDQAKIFIVLWSVNLDVHTRSSRTRNPISMTGMEESTEVLLYNACCIHL